MLELIGYPFSPFVRKVMVTLEYKGIDYDHDPLNPFTERERLLELNPRGAVPVLIIDGKPMAESADICHWLDESHTSPAIYSNTASLKTAIEETEKWADSELASIFGGGLFFQKIIKPLFLKQESDEERIQLCMTVKAPEVLAKLELSVPDEGYSYEEFSMADLAVSGWLRLGMLSGYEISEAKYPRLTNYLRRVFAIPAYASILERENQLDVIQHARKTFATDYAIIE